MTLRVLFCHGLESGPNGHKVRGMQEQGLQVTAPDMEMSLWNPRARNSVICSLLSPFSMFTRWPWQWLRLAIDDSLAACIAVQEAAISSAVQFDVLVGSSWGGAVAASLLAVGAWTGPTVLLCPALRIRDRRFGVSGASLSTDAIIRKLAALPAERRAQCLLVHGTGDTTIPLEDSRELSAMTGIPLEIIHEGSHGLGVILRDGRLLQFIERVATTKGATAEVLTAEEPMLPVNATADTLTVSGPDRLLVWHFRHGESTANLAGKRASAEDKARGDGLATALRAHEADVAFADAPLTETGIQQARDRKAEISGWMLRPTLVVCSPLLRAIQTATLIFEPDLSAGVPLVIRPELREFFPNLAQSRGRQLAAIRSDPAVAALPNQGIVQAALSDDACEDWRHEWDTWQACGLPAATAAALQAGGKPTGWQVHSGDGKRIAAFKGWLAQQPHQRVATVSHFGTCNALVNHEPCVEASGLPRQPAEEIGINAFAWRLGVLPEENGFRGTRVEMPNCGHIVLVYRAP